MLFSLPWILFLLINHVYSLRRSYDVTWTEGLLWLRHETTPLASFSQATALLAVWPFHSPFLPQSLSFVLLSLSFFYHLFFSIQFSVDLSAIPSRGKLLLGKFNVFDYSVLRAGRTQHKVRSCGGRPTLSLCWLSHRTGWVDVTLMGWVDVTLMGWVGVTLAVSGLTTLALRFCYSGGMSVTAERRG